MKFALTVFLLCFIGSSFAQITGTVTSDKNEKLPYVNIYLEHSVTGTTTNNDGVYELDIQQKGTYTIVFQFLGYETKKQKITVRSFPYQLNVVLKEQGITLNEVSISSKENIAYSIIKNAIASKYRNTQNLNQYTANFYSRGLFKIKNAPKRILGQSLGDLGGSLDSTRSGIIYLSETISKISLRKKPKAFKEHIIASKVSGKSNGIAFNQAKQVNFNLYNNRVEINGTKLVSPISDYAFAHYKYKLIGTFYDKDGRLINKIKLMPKRKNDRVFEGYIYVVEDEWAISGAVLMLNGTQMNNPGIKNLTITQDYNFSEKNNQWLLISQVIDFKAGMFGININGRFSASYTNYNLQPRFSKKHFGNEVLNFAENATKKDSLYWNKIRPIPLTNEEKKDYKVKEKIRWIRKSKKYLDSIDKSQNKFSWTTSLSGYTYKNSYKKWEINLASPLLNTHFSTVQGLNASIAIDFIKRLNEQGKQYRLTTNWNYSFSEKKVRPTATFFYKWNNIEKPMLQLSGGIKTNRFNERDMVSENYNTITTLLLEKNMMKLYEKSFIEAYFASDVANGVRLFTGLEYVNRKPLLNTSNYKFIDLKNIEYTSNNPLHPTSVLHSFKAHKALIINVGVSIHFGNKYMTYPDGRWSIGGDKFPELYVSYRRTVGLKNSKLSSDLFLARVQQKVSLGNLGTLSYNIRSGIFINQKNIPFMDYLHPNGNQFMVIFEKNYNNHFKLLNHYALSTNDKYSELHIEHNFKGFVLGKIPLLNKLDFHLVLGAKGLFVANNKPYTEYSMGINHIGWGKWRFLRVDYVQSYFATKRKKGFFVGVTLPF